MSRDLWDCWDDPQTPETTGSTGTPGTTGTPVVPVICYPPCIDLFCISPTVEVQIFIGKR
jgi:hypothetical protein